MPHLSLAVFAVATLVVVSFQLALAAGAPWGELTQGGRHHGKLPVPSRVIAAASAFLLMICLAIVLARAGHGAESMRSAANMLVWAVVALMALSCVANAITPSKRERALWLPVALCMLLSSTHIALT